MDVSCIIKRIDNKSLYDQLFKIYHFLDNRGFMTANGQPDQSRSARYVLKDYVSGRLLFCHAPPDAEQDTFHTYPERVRREIPESELPVRQQRAMRVCAHIIFLTSVFF